MTNDLPPGWARALLGSVCKVEYGKGLAKRQRIEAGSVGVYGSAGVVGHHDRALVDEPVVIVGRKGNAGAVWHTEEPSWPIDTTYFLRIPRGICAKYLGMQLGHLDLVEYDSSTTIPSLRRPDLEAASIAIAPSVEQERIVAAIEAHFSRLAATESALNSAQQRLDALMQSVLRATCEGPWTTRPLAQVIKSLKNGVFVSRPSATPPGHPIYRISAVRPLVLRIDDIRYADPVPEGVGAYAVEARDILFTRYSGNPSYVGAAAVVPQAGAGILYPDKLIRVIADRDTALPEWIAAYVTAGQGRREVEKRLKTTAGQVGISGSQLRTVPIAIPPIGYQERAVYKIGMVLAEQEQMRMTFSAARAKVAALRRSILALAFTGQLVPQDRTNEPASALLERIATTRAPKARRSTRDH